MVFYRMLVYYIILKLEACMSEGIIQFYYGEGHGKTTAAIGSAINAASEGKEAIIIQFLKARQEHEINFYKKLEPSIKYFNFSKADVCYNELDEEKRKEEMLNLQNGFNYGRKVIQTGACDLIVLDEILGLADLKIVTVEEIRRMLSSVPENMTVICTGRVLNDRLRDLADEIYNIAPEK